jgi:chromosome segregation ATPase
LPDEDEDEDVTAEIDNTDPEGTIRLQRLLSEAFAKVGNVSEIMLEKDNVSKVSTDFAELKAEYSKTSSQERCELLVNLEEREESLKGSKKRIAALEGAVERQADLHHSLQIKLERADDEIDEMESEIRKLEDEIGTLQEIYYGYEELQQELVKQKEKVPVRELSVQALKEDQSGGVKALEEKSKSQKWGASAKLSEKNDAIAALQKELLQLRNIAIARGSSEDQQYFLQELQEYKAEVVVVRNSLEDARRQIGILEEDNEELQSAKENLEDEAMSLKANVTKIAEESNTFQKEVTVWTEAAKEWKRRAEAAQKQLDAGSPDTVDNVTQVIENSKTLPPDICHDSKRRSCEVTTDPPQALFLQAAMERKRERQRTSGNRLLRNRSIRAVLFQPMT